MPVERRAVSLSMFSEMIGIDPARFLGVEYDARTSSVTLVLEDDMQQTGTFPQIHDNTSRGGKGGGSAKHPKSGGPKKV